MNKDTKKLRLGQKIKVTSVDELFGILGEESSLELEISAIHPFPEHPYRVVDDAEMEKLVHSIEQNGVLTPVLVRAVGNGYEMISGHRRMYAAKKAGLKKIPGIIRNLTDDEATIVMVEANAQREKVLPSEKAFAYKMRYLALKRQGDRRDLTSSQVGTKLRTDIVVAKEMGESRNQMHRYIRLTELLPELLEFVDQKKLAFVTAVDISYVDHEIQKYLYEYILENRMVKTSQISQLRKYLENDENLDKKKVFDILNESISEKKKQKTIHFSERKLRHYFPTDYTAEDMENMIWELLEKWKISQELLV